MGTAGCTSLSLSLSLGGGDTFSNRLSGDSRERPLFTPPRAPSAERSGASENPRRPPPAPPHPNSAPRPPPAAACGRWDPCRPGTQLTADRQWYFPSAWVSGAGLIQRCFSISLTPHCPPLIAEMLMSCLAWKWFLHLRWEGFALIGGRGRDGGAHLSEFSREFTPCPPSAGPPRAPRWWWGSQTPFLAFLSEPGSRPCQSPSQLKCWGGWSVLGVFSCPPPQPGAVGVWRPVFPLAPGGEGSWCSSCTEAPSGPTRACSW